MSSRLTPDYSSAEASCPVVTGRDRIADAYLPYTTDESRVDGTLPERIYFPHSTDHVKAAVEEIKRRGESVTVSGARTGIVAGAVADAPNVVSLEKLTGPVSLRRDPELGWIAAVRAGVTLEELDSVLSDGRFETTDETPEDPPEALFYPVDPTEVSATVGGTIATNASGARTLKYGPTRVWVHGLTVVTPDGGVLRLKRGRTAADGGTLELQRPDGTVDTFAVPDLDYPDTKHTAGYELHESMDAVDLFVGAEGTLGIVTEAELRLASRPAELLCLFVFLPTDEPGRLVRALKNLQPAAIEYMDANSIDLLIEAKDKQLDGGAVPDLPENTRAALYVELEADDEAGIEELYDRLAPILEDASVSIDDTWAGFTDQDLAAMKRFRHALPERVNAIIAERKREEPELSKIGTDMAVPDDAFDEMLDLYRTTLAQAKLDYCIFGHIGNGHVHVNILPNDVGDRDRGYELYKVFAKRAVELGGSVSAEHGIGRLKRPFMHIQYPETVLEQMKAVKRLMDPDGTLNPGVLLE